MKTLKHSLLVLTLLAITVACNHDDKRKNTASLHVKMTDAPAVFNQVNVEVLRVEAQIGGDTTSSGWHVLATDSGVYDLLELVSDTVLIAHNTNLPAGRLNQIRLFLGENNTIMADSVIYDLKVPSGQQSGYKIKVHEDLNAGESFELTIDFDAHESVVVTGNPNQRFLLKPVIDAVDFRHR